MPSKEWENAKKILKDMGSAEGLRNSSFNTVQMSHLAYALRLIMEKLEENDKIEQMKTFVIAKANSNDSGLNILIGIQDILEK